MRRMEMGAHGWVWWCLPALAVVLLLVFMVAAAVGKWVRFRDLAELLRQNFERAVELAGEVLKGNETGEVDNRRRFEVVVQRVEDTVRNVGRRLRDRLGAG